MKKIFFIILTLSLFNVEMAMAYHDRAWNKGHENSRAVNASGCTRATTSTTIEYNNVRALIHTGGDMWWDLVALPKYEIPKGSGKTALFAGAIWMGGTDVNDQLRLAAVKFRSGGVDYWPGPLIVSGMDQATVTSEVCLEYDRHFVITRQEVSEFRTYMQAFLGGDTETIENDYSDYQIPDIIINWPGNGKTAQGYDSYLAPYVDADANGYYNPETGGDYPFFDLDGTELCGTSRELRKPRLFGDQTMWWVYNDKGNIHTETNGEAIGMEVRAQYFAFATADELNNMTFGNYALINRSTYTLYNTYFGVWTDADLGYAYDDYVGCDVTRGLGYLYNGNQVDGTGNGNEYGENPPAIGVDFFEGPYMDPWIGPAGDTIDRPSPYLFDSYGNKTSIIDTSMVPVDAPDGLFNGGINGLNFGDSIGGNERWGMRRFLYFNNTGIGPQGDPELAQEYYYYLDGKWKDGRKMVYGGTGYAPDGIKANFMFPGTTDPYLWGTNGVDPGYTTPGGWTEENESNPASDRRFVQSAGPFTLQPGAVNDITVGMVWARTNGGSAFESVKKVQEADDKAQQLFDNCFVMIDGPDSPELNITELDGELLFQIYNLKGLSNNFNDYSEDYSQKDPFIVIPDSVVTIPGDTITASSITVINNGGSQVIIPQDGDTTYVTQTTYEYHRPVNQNPFFKFEGYQVYQVKDNSVTTSDLDDPTFSRLVFQCDIKNDVDEIVNYEIDPITGDLMPSLKVVGNNEGIKHTFRLTEDAFAEADKALVNHKKYYFIAVAYAYNNFKTYDPEDGTSFNGQKTPYLRGRKSAKGSIKTFMGIPHINKIQNGGIEINSQYGDPVDVKMLDGIGNSNNLVNITQSTIDRIMSGFPWKTDVLEYETGYAPIEIKVVDPLNVQNDSYILRFDSVQYPTVGILANTGYINDANWYVYPAALDSVQIDSVFYIKLNDTLVYQSDKIYSSQIFEGIDSVLVNFSGSLEQIHASDSFKVSNPQFVYYKKYPTEMYYSDNPISIINEQIISELGISISINQTHVPGASLESKLDYETTQNGYLGSSIEYVDYEGEWLTGVYDIDGQTEFNWIRTGKEVSEEEPLFYNASEANDVPIDPSSYWNSIANSWFSWYRLAMYDDYANDFGAFRSQVRLPKKYATQTILSDNYHKNYRASSIDIVITPDTTLWSRCPVIEMCEYDTVAVVGSSGITYTFKAGPSVNGAEKFHLRRSPSVYRNGMPIPAEKVDSFWLHDRYIKMDSGMGWFPGYAVDITTGERLNIFFGEDSRWAGYNGADMMWNPHYMQTTSLFSTTGATQDIILGAKHNLYVWGHSLGDTTSVWRVLGSTGKIQFLGDNASYASTAYDEGKLLYTYLKLTEDPLNITSSKSLEAAWNSVQYVGRLMLHPDYKEFVDDPNPYAFIRSEVKIKIRTTEPYRGKVVLTGTNFGGTLKRSKYLKPDSLTLNNNEPMFAFSTEGLGASFDNSDVAESALDIINVVPNPYYAYDSYELKQTQKLVKFTNLPEECTITIYNIGGNKIRKFDKSSPLTYLDWDLKNEYGIEIASGVYIIHINVPGVGEKVLKWFGALRPIDLNNI